MLAFFVCNLLVMFVLLINKERTFCQLQMPRIKITPITKRIKRQAFASFRRGGKTNEKHRFNLIEIDDSGYTNTFYNTRLRDRLGDLLNSAIVKGNVRISRNLYQKSGSRGRHAGFTSGNNTN